MRVSVTERRLPAQIVILMYRPYVPRVRARSRRHPPVIRIGDATVHLRRGDPLVSRFCSLSPPVAATGAVGCFGGRFQPQRAAPHQRPP